MHTAFLCVISLAAYATGAVAARRLLRVRASAVSPLELLLLIILIATMVWRSHFSAAQFLISAAAAVVVGASFHGVTHASGAQTAGGTREYEDTVKTGTPSLWTRWLNFSRAVVDYEFRLLLIGTYLLIIGPMALAFRRLKPEAAGGESSWLKRNHAADIESARRPF